mmetsp:Transcript_35582/g.94663  ORF Transcript_35582/g.94663 Transcript_35582/m.94663 type:complete len:338 (+) Transcript_35582:501-1514(+)
MRKNNEGQRKKTDCDVFVDNCGIRRRRKLVCDTESKGDCGQHQREDNPQIMRQFSTRLEDKGYKRNCDHDAQHDQHIQLVEPGLPLHDREEHEAIGASRLLSKLDLRWREEDKIGECTLELVLRLPGPLHEEVRLSHYVSDMYREPLGIVGEVPQVHVLVEDAPDEEGHADETVDPQAVDLVHKTHIVHVNPIQLLNVCERTAVHHWSIRAVILPIEPAIALFQFAAKVLSSIKIPPTTQTRLTEGQTQLKRGLKNASHGVYISNAYETNADIQRVVVCLEYLGWAQFRWVPGEWQMGLPRKEACLEGRRTTREGCVDAHWCYSFQCSHGAERRKFG